MNKKIKTNVLTLALLAGLLTGCGPKDNVEIPDKGDETSQTEQDTVKAALKKAKELKIKSISTEAPPGNYTKEENKKAYNEKVELVKSKINALKTIEEVKAFNIASYFKDIKTDDQLEAKALAKAKEEKIGEIATTVPAENYTREENKNLYAERVETVTANINKLTTVKAVQTYDIAAQFADIDTDEEIEAKENEKLQAAITEKIAQIDVLYPAKNYTKPENETLYKNTVKSVTSAISKLLTIEEVEKYDIKAQFASIKTDAQLQEEAAKKLENAKSDKIATFDELLPEANYTKNLPEYKATKVLIVEIIESLKTLEEVNEFDIVEAFNDANIETDDQIAKRLDCNRIFNDPEFATTIEEDEAKYTHGSTYGTSFAYGFSYYGDEIKIFENLYMVHDIQNPCYILSSFTSSNMPTLVLSGSKNSTSLHLQYIALLPPNITVEKQVLTLRDGYIQKGEKYFKVIMVGKTPETVEVSKSEATYMKSTNVYIDTKGVWWTDPEEGIEYQTNVCLVEGDVTLTKTDDAEPVYTATVAGLSLDSDCKNEALYYLLNTDEDSLSEEEILTRNYFNSKYEDLCAMAEKLVTNALIEQDQYFIEKGTHSVWHMSTPVEK